ncbi:MAG: branched-chain amino acid ABC transporter permease [Pseudomonadota bacterium]
MDYALVLTVEIAYAVAVLVLISAGLAVIFGMMRVINLAHGEFLTLGGYAAITAHGLGLNIYLCMIIVAPAVVALFGFIVERLIVRFLYGRLINTMLATWGLSLAMMGGFTMIFGNTTTGIATPIPGITVGQYQIPGYNLFVIGSAIAIALGLYLVLRSTRVGLIARGAMQNTEMTSAFGFDPKRVYTLTFTAGAALSGLAGGIMAPLVGLNPASGANYIAKSFITVITGGASVVSGALASAGLLGVVSQTFTLLATPAVGEIALLVVAIVLLRLLPTGITGRFLRDKV